MPGRKKTTKGFHDETNGDYKTFTELNGCDRRKLSYGSVDGSTTL
jgi:hypothetical protein